MTHLKATMNVSGVLVLLLVMGPAIPAISNMLMNTWVEGVKSWDEALGLLLFLVGAFVWCMMITGPLLSAARWVAGKSSE